MGDDHPVRFSVEYPDRQLNRVSSAFRIFAVIPIAIVLSSIGGYASSGHYEPPARTSVRRCRRAWCSSISVTAIL